MPSSLESLDPAPENLYKSLNNDHPSLDKDVEHLEIRTVTLLPGPTLVDKEIRCLLENTTIRESKNSYYALSYHWGDNTNRRTIKLNCQDFEVTENLWQALCHLRNKTERRTFWIGAICIDQNNCAERSSQVRHMASIYKHGLETTVFLGKETEDTELSVAWIEKVAKAILAERDEEHKMPTVHDPVTSASIKATEMAFNQPWWRRVWVTQEVAVAKTVTVMWGARSLPWKYYDIVIETYVSWYLGRIRDFPNFGAAYFPWDAASAIQVARSRVQGSQYDHGLTTFLIRFRGFGSSDPRDKVYGLLQLSRESAFIIPNYDHSVAEVFKEIVQQSISQSRSLAILSTVNYSKRNSSLPSWCPDWSGPAPEYRPLFSRELRSAGDSEAAAQFNGDLLTLRGIRVDSIARLYKLPGNRKELNSKELYAIEHLASPNDAQFSPYKREQVRLDVVREILELNTLGRFYKILTSLQHHWYQSGTGEGTGEETVEQVYAENYIQKMLEDRWATGRRAWLNGTGGSMPPHQGEGRSFFVSDNGYLGLAPTAAQNGDVVVVLYAGRLPFCIRPLVNQKSFELIGECYMDSYMRGEALEQAAQGKLSEQNFDLV